LYEESPVAECAQQVICAGINNDNIIIVILIKVKGMIYFKTLAPKFLKQAVE
jgi:hypothetical protein